jgi:hypothetical protein
MSDQNKQEEPKKRSAGERLDDLENAVMSLFQLSDNITRDILTIKEALKLLNNKVDAMAKASVSGEQFSDDVLKRIMIENNCAELASKVNAMIEQGFLVSEGEVSENSFVVGEEVDNDGKVLNPRLQFVFQALKPELKEKLLGVKTGDTATITDVLKFHVSESYRIQQPQAPAEEAAAPVEPTTDTQAAPEPAPSQSN